MEWEVFEAGLAERPELMNDILEKLQDQVTTGLQGRGLHVATTDQYTKDREAAIGQGSKTAHEAWEGFFSEITGQQKPEGKKGIDWAKEQREKIKYGEATGDDSANQTLIRNLQKEKTKLEKELETERGGVWNAKVDAVTSTGIESLKFRIPADITDDAQKQSYLRDQADGNRAMFNSKYKAEKMADGSVLFKDLSGNAMIDGSGKPLTVNQIFVKNHGYLLQPSSFQQGGTGGGSGSEQQQETDGFLGATPVEISQGLSKLGLGTGTAKWKEAYEKAYKAAGYVRDGDAWVKPAGK